MGPSETVPIWDKLIPPAVGSSCGLQPPMAILPLPLNFPRSFCLSNAIYISNICPGLGGDTHSGLKTVCAQVEVCTCALGVHAHRECLVTHFSIPTQETCALKAVQQEVVLCV